MSSRKRRRALGLVSMVIIASLAFSASALAAKPKGMQIERVETGINFAKVKGTANPNGLSTTLTFEKWNESTAKWEGLSTSSIGSGTVAVTQEYTYTNLAAEKEYFFRVSATNASGTSSSGEVSFYPEWWSIEGYSGRHETTSAGQGTLRMEWQNLTGTPHVSSAYICSSESDSGTINHVGGSSRSVQASSCKFYQNGVFQCNAPEVWFTINSGWQIEPSLSLSYPICGSHESVAPVRLTEPFRVSSSGSGNKNPVTMTANMNFFGSPSYPGVFTIESTWSLSGADAGKTFFFASE